MTVPYSLRHSRIVLTRLSMILFLATCWSTGEDVQAHQTTRKHLKSGDRGPLVENLQRTLNARLKPSPKLSIDGDYGPNTRKAVLQFQRLNRLPTSGTVDTATWKALGVLVTRDATVPSPQVINQQTLSRAAADSLTGPPFVTCKAWAIADANTGKILWGHDANKSLDMASTTKIMTAYLVLKEAQENPATLEETVTFSARADNTRGSTAGIRMGESLPVKELLYGLMLPSGNDASVALAEHFGGRLRSTRKSRTVPSYDQFIVRMNQAAEQLAMAKTRFVNPHGLTAEGHQTTASDLIRLAHQAMQLPTFRKYVATRQHGCTLTDRSGVQRNVIWKNTNRLLAIKGYLGVKTGTTTAAGACLVSCSQRGNRQLLMVVLGASSSDARYTDSRNLYRWAWQQLE